MKSNEFKKSYLYEGLLKEEIRSVKLWESAGRYIAEAQLTAQQIAQLFQQVEQDVTAQGNNRTLIGQGKDAAGAVARAYQDLKGKVETSATMQYFDQKYEEAAEKLKQATGGDQGVMTYVQKYRDFAKAHPIAQSLIYGTLIAAAGITGAGAGGAAALGLFKMADKLLQGEKFSAAAVAGAETGLAAFAASKLGDLIRGVKPGEQVPAPTDGQPISTAGYDFANKDYYLSPSGTQTIAVPKGYGSPWEEGTKAYNIRQQLKSQMGVQESVVYTPAQITALFESIAIQEGLWDQFKQKSLNVIGSPEERAEVSQQIKQGVSKVAGAVAQKAQTVGTNLTTKVTADKLRKAWATAGSPTDSNQLTQFLVKQGIDAGIVNNSLKAVGVEAQPSAQLPDISKLSKEQMQQLLALLDQPASKQHTGGKVAGQVSQTPNAIRKRQARAAQKEMPAVFTSNRQSVAESYEEFKQKLQEAKNK